MLDLRRIREEPDAVSAALTRRDPDLAGLVEEVLARDREWRAATTAAESLRARQRDHSDAIAAAKRAGGDVTAELAEMKRLSTEVKDLGERARAAQEQLHRALALLPNLPDASAPAGPEDEVVRVVGDVPAPPFEPRDHLQLAARRSTWIAPRACRGRALRT